ncbi:MAG: UbiA family prenyltransferase [Deltaproteobacteria bacterium]|nr:UbiA family prenyltransferase [Deltaproteobacteria bacterium]
MDQSKQREQGLGQHLVLWGRLVRFSHTIFAMPFALSMFVYVSSFTRVRAPQLLAIVTALVAARTAAMTFNRIIDRDIDGLNPRTRNREIPAGVITVRSAWVLWASSCALFLAASWFLGMHCLVLAPLVLAVLCYYSWAKRFTSLSHAILGLALALAPGGVWYALTGSVAWLPVWMMLGVLFWVAGFDILYSCQDIEFDRQHALWSVPSRYGEARAFQVSRIFHALAVLCLAQFGAAAHLAPVFWLGLLLFALLLFQQHRIVGPGNLTRIDAAFFTQNGLASILFFLAVLLAVYS